MVKRIVAFAGHEGSGKSYQASLLVNNKGYHKMAFADALRKILFVTLGISYERGMEQYDELKKTPIYNGQTLRNMLEHLGTEGIRKYDNDFWARCLIKDLSETPEDENICIEDLRFYNEYKYLKDFCDEKGYQFDFVFCDYHSDRYRADNPHPSARLANFLKEVGYSDLDAISDEDMQVYIESMDALIK